MNAHAIKSLELRRRPAASRVAERERGSESDRRFADATSREQQLTENQGVANGGPRLEALTQLQGMANSSPRLEALAQLQGMVDRSPRQRKRRRQAQSLSGSVSENRTGMPDRLKAGLETLSGVDLSEVSVHYNSAKPAQLNALAYTQGREIHVGPGQERHVPHEGWHAVQQIQGRVRPTTRAGGVAINDDAGLEREADVMGARAIQMRLDDPLPLQLMTLAREHGSADDWEGAEALQRVLADRGLLHLATTDLSPVQFAASAVVQLEGDGIWDTIWGFVATIQNLSFYDAVIQLINLSAAVTATVAASTDDTDTAVAAAILQLTADTSDLARDYNAYRVVSDSNDTEDILEASAKVFEGVMKVVGGIGGVFAARFGGGTGAMAGILITKAVAKALTAVYVGYKKRQQRQAFQEIMV